jgi:hypothetical protein
VLNPLAVAIIDQTAKSLICNKKSALFVCLEKCQTNQTNYLVIICKSAVWLTIPTNTKQPKWHKHLIINCLQKNYVFKHVPGNCLLLPLTKLCHQIIELILYGYYSPPARFPGFY